MEFKAPAKINLRLEVLGRRQDGYHEIRTLMHRVDLEDELDISLRGREIRLSAEGEGIPKGGENLVCRAARVFFEESDIQRGIHIRLKKKFLWRPAWAEEAAMPPRC